MAKIRRQPQFLVRDGGLLWDLASGQGALDFDPGFNPGPPPVPAEQTAPSAARPTPAAAAPRGRSPRATAAPLALPGIGLSLPLAPPSVVPMPDDGRVLPFRGRAAAREDDHSGLEPNAPFDAEAAFAAAAACEVDDPAAARAAYVALLAEQPSHLPALLNLGRLLHQAADLDGAERCFRAARALAPQDVVAAFNLGVVCEDRGNLDAAAEAYRDALRGDATHADAHYNLSGVLERQGDRTGALQHLKTYRRLARR